MLTVALCGGIGAVVRFLVDSTIAPRCKHLPLGTLVVNVFACFLAGLVANYAVMSWVPAQIMPYLSMGFLGGYSTFSTAVVEIVRLADKEHNFYAVLQLVLMVGLSFIAFMLGYLI